MTVLASPLQLPLWSPLQPPRFSQSQGASYDPTQGTGEFNSDFSTAFFVVRNTQFNADFSSAFAIASKQSRDDFSNAFNRDFASLV